MSRPVIFLDDPFRPTIYSWRNYFDHFQAIFKRAFGIQVQSPKWEPSKSKHLNFNDFYEACDFSPEENLYWGDIWFAGSEEAQKYLAKHLPKGVIIILHEAPPWLIDFFKKESIMFIDTKSSNIRFTADIPIMISTNIASLAKTIYEKYHYIELDIKFEAQMLRALIRQRFIDKLDQFKPYNRKLIFIGQTSIDSSIIINKKGRGYFARLEEFIEPVLALLKEFDGLIYQKHPLAEVRYGKHEAGLLSSVNRKPVLIGDQLLYNIYSLAEDIHAVGFSSGGLVEAPFFGQPSTMLLGNSAQPYYSANDGVCAYLNLRARDFLSPAFWQDALADILEPLSPFTDNLIFESNSFRMRNNASFNYFKIINQMSWVQRDFLNVFNLEDADRRLAKLEQSRPWARIKKFFSHCFF